MPGGCRPTAPPSRLLPGPHSPHPRNPLPLPLPAPCSAACWETNGQRVYTCVVADLQAEDRARYGPTIQKWVEAFPGEQLHIVQVGALLCCAALRCGAVCAVLCCDVLCCAVVCAVLCCAVLYIPGGTAARGAAGHCSEWHASCGEAVGEETAQGQRAVAHRSPPTAACSLRA